MVLLVLLVPGVKWARNVLARRRAGRRPRDAVAESYAELTSWARDAGIGRRRAETPAAYARRLSGDFAADADPLVELTGLFEQAEYAPAEPGADQADEARRLARQRQGQPGRPARLAPAAGGRGQPPQPGRSVPPVAGHGQRHEHRQDGRRPGQRPGHVEAGAVAEQRPRRPGPG